MATLPALHHWCASGDGAQSEYGNLAGFGDRRDSIGQTERRGKTERPVVPETSRRRERGQRNGSGSFGHGRNSDRSPLPRRSSLPDPSNRAPLPESATELPPLPAVFWQTVDAGLHEADVTLAPEVRVAIDRHVRLLLAWNTVINLTALRTPEQIARNHVLDSLICVDALRDLGRASSLLDIGSGAGFPGLPLVVTLPAARAALVDSIGKKARFLGVAAAQVVEALAIDALEPPNITALAERAEDLGQQPNQRASWDLVTARAVGTVAEVAELGLPLASRGGHVVCWKLDSGDGALQREIAAARRICQAAGGGEPRMLILAAAERVGLPGHCLIAIEKRRETPDRYPRPAVERRRAPLLS